MARINDNYLKLKAGYLFPEIGRRVKAFAQEHPEAKIIRLGIGDVTQPLPRAVLTAPPSEMQKRILGLSTICRRFPIWLSSHSADAAKRMHSLL